MPLEHHTDVCEKTLLRIRRQVGTSASRAPNLGLDCSFRCWVACQGSSKRSVVSTDTGTTTYRASQMISTHISISCNVYTVAHSIYYVSCITYHASHLTRPTAYAISNNTGYSIVYMGHHIPYPIYDVSFSICSIPWLVPCRTPRAIYHTPLATLRVSLACVALVACRALSLNPCNSNCDSNK